MSRLAGWDLNGSWDWAAVPEADGGSRTVDGGIAPAVVRLQSRGSRTDERQRLMGGLEATVAPHGRGPGWGDIGHPRLRRSIAAALDPKAEGSDQAPAPGLALAAQLAALAPRARSGFLAVPDHPAFDEDAQDQRLTRIRRAPGAPTVTLLWRPLAALLGWAARDPDAAATLVGRTVAMAILGGGGINIADAVLERHPTRSGSIVVPVRRRPGWHGGGELAGRRLVDAAAARLRAAIAREEGNDELAAALADEPGTLSAQLRAPWLEAVGRATEPEPYRLPTTVWRLLPPLPRAPGPGLEPDPIPPGMLEGRLDDAAMILLSGPFVGNATWRQSVVRALGLDPADPRLVVGEVADAARGCLEAELRRARGEPVYFDFLPQLEINALVDGRPAFVDLIPRDARVPGGERYTGKAAADFGLPTGARALDFYIIRQGDPRARRWTVDLADQVPDAAHRIEVTVEQTPAQGRARVALQSDTYEPFRVRPPLLVWAEMREVDGSRDEILARLEDTALAGAFPDAVPLKPHPALWGDEVTRNSLTGLLRQYVDGPVVALGVVCTNTVEVITALPGRLRKASLAYLYHQYGLDPPPEASFTPIGSDGSLPTSEGPWRMPHDAGDLIDRAIRKAVTDARTLDGLRDPLAAGARQTLLNFLTWTFARAPQAAITILEAEFHRKVPIDERVLYYGFCRMAASPETIREAFARTTDAIAKHGAKIYHMQGLGFLLSRRAEAAGLLTSQEANVLADAVLTLLRAENSRAGQKSYKNLFTASLQVLGGILRYRQRSPDFLVPAIDPRGRVIAEALTAARKRVAQLASSRKAKPGLKALSNVIDDLVEYLHRRGRSPNILVLIEEIGT